MVKVNEPERVFTRLSVLFDFPAETNKTVVHSFLLGKNFYMGYATGAIFADFVGI